MIFISFLLFISVIIFVSFFINILILIFNVDFIFIVSGVIFIINGILFRRFFYVTSFIKSLISFIIVIFVSTLQIIMLF